MNKIELFAIFKIICIMRAIEWFSPYKYWRNTKIQSNTALKSDIIQKVAYKVVFVGFLSNETDRAICTI